MFCWRGRSSADNVFVLCGSELWIDVPYSVQIWIDGLRIDLRPVLHYFAKILGAWYPHAVDLSGRFCAGYIVCLGAHCGSLESYEYY